MMEIFFVIALLLYMLSSAGYFTYLIFQKPFLQKAGIIFIIAGFACHTITMILGYLATGRMPVNNLFETLSMAGWAMAAVFLLFQIRFRINVLGVYAAPLVAMTLLIAYQLPRAPLPNQNLFRSIWLVAHILTVFIGDAAFALACGVGILYLLQERAIKTKAPGFFFRRLPSLELIDTTGYACIVSGFTLLTIGLITGIIYAKSVWGRFWGWDPKEVWSAISWIFYAILLHERLAVGWRGRRAAIMAIVGFAVLLFTFFGVNFLMQGHHGQFTTLK